MEGQPRKVSLYETIIIMAVIGAISLAFVFLSQYFQAHPDPRQAIAEQICRNLSYSFVGYNSATGEVECSVFYANITQHLNISGPNTTIMVKPDWGYYEGKKE